jgi:hypothetical protein
MVRTRLPTLIRHTWLGCRCIPASWPFILGSASREKRERWPQVTGLAFYLLGYLFLQSVDAFFAPAALESTRLFLLKKTALLPVKLGLFAPSTLF